jgi:hypothetical protein
VNQVQNEQCLTRLEVFNILRFWIFGGKDIPKNTGARKNFTGVSGLYI